MTAPAIPIAVLIEARECLAIARQFCPAAEYNRLLKAHSHLDYLLKKAMLDMQVEVMA